MARMNGGDGQTSSEAAAWAPPARTLRRPAPRAGLAGRSARSRHEMATDTPGITGLDVAYCAGIPPAATSEYNMARVITVDKCGWSCWHGPGRGHGSSRPPRLARQLTAAGGNYAYGLLQIRRICNRPLVVCEVGSATIERVRARGKHVYAGRLRRRHGSRRASQN